MSEKKIAKAKLGIEYVPTDKVYYAPTDQGYEETLRRRLEAWRARRAASASSAGDGGEP